MANTTLGSTSTGKIRLINANLTAAQWATCAKIPLKGELCIETDTLKMKVGDGTNTYAKLQYMYLTKAEVQELIVSGAFDLLPATKEALGGVIVGDNIDVASNGKISVKNATLAQKGVVQLSSDTNSPSEETAATSKAVKTVYDYAATKANATHNHDDAYYTKDAVDQSLAGKADKVHNHDDKYYTEDEIDGKVSGLQSSIEAKQDKITGAGSTIVTDNLDADLALISDKSGKVAVSTVSATELGFVKGVTSGIQAQLDGKSASGHKHTKEEITNFPTQMPASDVHEWAKAENKPTYTANEVGAIPATDKGAANCIATLDQAGKVPAAQLPSYVDDVLEYTNKAGFPETGESGIIYIDKETNKTYRWSGTLYVEISPSLALGNTASTAFRGDHGQTAYEHALSAHVTGVKGASEKDYRVGQINITAENVGAAPAVHTHNYAGSATAGGAANSAVKLQTARNFSITGAATAAAVGFTGEGNVALNVTQLNATALYLAPSDVLILDGSSYFATA